MWGLRRSLKKVKCHAVTIWNGIAHIYMHEWSLCAKYSGVISEVYTFTDEPRIESIVGLLFIVLTKWG